MNEPIYKGILQSDLDCAHFNLLNFSGGGGGGSTEPNTVVATDIGMVCDGVTDNTSALQTWLNSVGTAKVSSTLLVPDGVYIFSGPLQDTGLGSNHQNAQILLPSEGRSSPKYTITIKGYHALSNIPWFNTPAPLPKGPIFKSTLATGGAAGTQPAFIGGYGPTGGEAGYTPQINFLCLRLANIVFQTVPNPLISCLNLSAISDIEFAGNVIVTSVPTLNYVDTVQPTTLDSYGVILPATGYTIGHRIEDLHVWNFFTGVRMGELTRINNLFCYFCVHATEYPAYAMDVILIDRFWMVNCPYGITITGPTYFQITQMFTELGPTTGWTNKVYDIDDVSNQANAEITSWSAIDNAGNPSQQFIVRGGAHINASPCGGPRYIGRDARLASISGGVKLQTRNPATDTWLDSAQWTNP